MLSKEHARLVVEAELAACQGFAARRGMTLDWLPEPLKLRVVLPQPGGLMFHLEGEFENYREYPPRWRFLDDAWREPGPFPRADGSAPGSIFHTNRVICVPFNRLAYAMESNLHGDWKDLAQWITYAPGSVHGRTIAEMLSIFDRDIRRSAGVL